MPVRPYEIIEVCLPALNREQVSHYTRIGTLNYFIPVGKQGWASAWATPVQFLNDRSELLLGLEILREFAVKDGLRKSVRSLLESLLRESGNMETDAFQMSFSGNSDELGQWRGYASNGMGCCVVTSVEAIREVADVAGWVVYEKSKQVAFARKVLQSLRKQQDQNFMRRVLVASACFIKDKGFLPEQEFRVIVFPPKDQVRFRESGDRLVPYVDFLGNKDPLPIEKIILGPGWRLANLTPLEWNQNHVVQGIYRLLEARGLPWNLVDSSSIPYDPK